MDKWEEKLIKTEILQDIKDKISKLLKGIVGKDSKVKKHPDWNDNEWAGMLNVSMGWNNKRLKDIELINKSEFKNLIK